MKRKEQRVEREIKEERNQRDGRDCGGGGRRIKKEDERKVKGY